MMKTQRYTLAILFGVVLFAVTVTMVWAQGPAPRRTNVPNTNADTTFTYQGQLKKSGSLYTGACDFQFSLYDALSGGSQVGSTVNVNSVSVTSGLFSVPLDFGNQFKGEARWLEIAVQCAGDGGFTTLNGRTQLTATPYALSLVPGAVISGTGALGLQVNMPNGNAIVGTSKANGYAAIFGSDTSSTGGYGVYGLSQYGSGLYARSTYSDGLYVDSAGSYGVWMNSAVYDGLYVNSAGDDGLQVNSAGSDGVYVYSAGATGVHVWNAVLDGVWAKGGAGYSGVQGYNPNLNSIGVKGTADSSGSVGVWGQSNTNTGVYGLTTDGKGVWGASNGSGYAGYFSGNVQVAGNLHVTGTCCAAALFYSQIDHPLDPANQYLSHSFVESPDMMNVYNGNATTDANGDALVTLPAYFQALNKDYRYQLTVMGTFAQAIIAEEITDNHFRIKTDKPNVKVSWQVTGIRQDPYANAHRIVVEEPKTGNEQGKYLYPELYGKDETWGIGTPAK